MKSLTLARPLILIMAGLPGAGKSFFARQFSDMFGAPIVSFNRLQFELFETSKPSADELNLVNRLALYQIEELVKTRRSFLVDGGSYTLAERQRFAKTAKEHGYDTLVIWVQTDDITCRQRAVKRNPKRSEDDAIAPSITESQWAASAKRFTAPTRERSMVISGKHAFSTQAKMVLRKLAEPHAAQAETEHQKQKQERPATQLERSQSRPAQPRRPQPATRRSVVIS